MCVGGGLHIGSLKFIQPMVQENVWVELSAGFTPCRHQRPYSGREHNFYSHIIYSVRCMMMV